MKLNSVWEFARIYHGCETLSTFRKRRYKFLPFAFRRNSRLITTVFSMKAWILLLIGILVVSPYLMSLWLTLNTFIIVIDFSILIMEILVNETEIRFTTFLSEAFYLISVLFVRCVWNVFQLAVDQKETDHLQLFQWHYNKIYGIFYLIHNFERRKKAIFCYIIIAYRDTRI